MTFPRAQIVRGPSTLWWTGAINLALRAALAEAGPEDWILCLNDDTEFDPDYVASLLATAGRSPRRLVGSVNVDAADPRVIVDGGNLINWYTAAITKLNRGRRLAELPAGHEEAVNVLAGRGTLAPVSAFRDLGLFAEDGLPHYGADYEFAARCLRGGYDLVVSYDAVVRGDARLTGIHRPARRWSMQEARNYFWDRRSSCNLPDRLTFSWMTRRNPAQAAVYFLASVIRVTARYLAGRPGPA